VWKKTFLERLVRGGNDMAADIPQTTEGKKIGPLLDSDVRIQQLGVPWG